jgi:hypothetical protein
MTSVTGPSTLVYIYGPPAVGKLTVATALQRRTGYRLFHNHQTVNALREVFEFRSDAFTAVLHRTRLDVFETAAAHGIDLIFTTNSVWVGPDGRARFAEFADQAGQRTEAAGGRAVFVQLVAPTEVLEARVASEARRQHGKLGDPARLLEMLDQHDPAPLHPADLIIDTSALSPPEAAATIAAALEERSTLTIGRPREAVRASYFYLDQLRPALELISEIMGYEFDAADWAAVEYGIQGTDPDEDGWFDYPIVGSTAVDVHLAAGDPDSGFVLLRMSGEVTSAQATRVETVIDVVNRYRLTSRHRHEVD